MTEPGAAAACREPEDPEAAALARSLGGAWRGAEVAVVLGSGLQGAADGMEIRAAVDYGDIEGLGAPSAPGHAGRLVRGSLGGVELVAFLGRRHLYEGIGPARAAYPARVGAALGAKLLLCLSAVGAVDPELATGSWVFVDDHLNLMGRNPLEGVAGPAGPAFVDLTAAYRADLYGGVAERLGAKGIPVARGVLAAFPGPSYETPAEVRMARLLGASIVGMSTVPEVVWARYLGLDALAWGRVANPAAGVAPGPLSHADVVARMGERPDEARTVLEESVAAWKGSLTLPGTPR